MLAVLCVLNQNISVILFLSIWKRDKHVITLPIVITGLLCKITAFSGQEVSRESGLFVRVNESRGQCRDSSFTFICAGSARKPLQIGIKATQILIVAISADSE